MAAAGCVVLGWGDFRDPFGLSDSTPRLYSTKVAAAPRTRKAYEKEQCRQFAGGELWVDEFKTGGGPAKAWLIDSDDD